MVLIYRQLDVWTPAAGGVNQLEYYTQGHSDNRGQRTTLAHSTANYDYNGCISTMRFSRLGLPLLDEPLSKPRAQAQESCYARPRIQTNITCDVVGIGTQFA